MHDIRRIDLNERILDENDRIADEIRRQMEERGILVVNIMGSPGAGKTSCLKALIKELSTSELLKDTEAKKQASGSASEVSCDIQTGKHFSENVSDGRPSNEAVRKIPLKCYVIEGDIESDIDTKALKALGIETVQINTFGSCHLDSPMIRYMLENHAFEGPGVLFIENIGNLVCPAEFTIGEHFLLLVASAAEGSDKPYKYPLAFEKADMVLLNKADLIPYVDFDEAFFMKGLKALNKKTEVFKVNGRTEEGFKAAAELVRERQKGLSAGK